MEKEEPIIWQFLVITQKQLSYKAHLGWILVGMARCPTSPFITLLQTLMHHEDEDLRSSVLSFLLL